MRKRIPVDRRGGANVSRWKEILRSHIVRAARCDLVLARPFVACRRCGSMMAGSGRGDLLGPCEPPRGRPMYPNRRARLNKLLDGQHPYGGTQQVATARDFQVNDHEVDWLLLRREPEA